MGGSRQLLATRAFTQEGAQLLLAGARLCPCARAGERARCLGTLHLIALAERYRCSQRADEGVAGANGVHDRHLEGGVVFAVVGTFAAEGSLEGSACEDCTAGTADTDSDPATECYSCAVGMYNPAASTSCIACAAGTADPVHCVCSRHC